MRIRSSLVEYHTSKSAVATARLCVSSPKTALAA